MSHDDKIHLEDNAAAFFRARAVKLREHIELMHRHITYGEVTTAEKVRLQKLMQNDEAHAQYWEKKAKSYKPRF